MIIGEAPLHRWAVHLITLFLAVSLHFLVLRLPQRSATFGLALPSLCLLLMALTLAAPGLEGVRRWVSIGPLLLHLSAMLAPLLLVACAMAARSHATFSLLLLVGAQALHLLQPDAGQATAFGIATLFITAGARRAVSLTVKVGLLSSVCCAWFLPDPLGPMPFVEDIVQRAFSIGLVTGVSAILALVLYAASPLWSTSPVWPASRVSEGAALRRMLAVYFSLTAVVSVFGEFPIPLVGYGPSPIIGAFLGLATLARAERMLSAEASKSRSLHRDCPSDTTFPCAAVSG